mgnify:CR=1 FL=1
MALSIWMQTLGAVATGAEPMLRSALDAAGIECSTGSACTAWTSISTTR